MNKRILFIGDHFGTVALPNGICAMEDIKELQALGNEVYVLAEDDGYQKKEEFFQGVHIDRIPADYTTRLFAWHAHHDSIGSECLFKIRYLLKNIRAFCFLWAWPFNAPINYFRMYRAAERIVKERRIDTIVCLYTPFNAVLTGHFLKRKHPELSYIVYFLDSLSGGIFPKLTSQEWVLKQGKKWEHFLLQNADAVYIMKAHEKHHQQYSSMESYYPRFRTMDIPLLNTAIINDVATEKRLPEGKINLVYLGSLKQSLKNPQFLLDVFQKADIKDTVLNFIGDPYDCQGILEEAKKKTPERINIIPSVPHSVIRSILAEADVLVNIGSTNTCQIPCKIFEYMSTGKPIVTTFSSENEPSLPYLREYGSAFMVDESANQDELAVKMADFLRNLPDRIDTATLNEKYYLCTPRAFCNALNEDT